MKRLWLRTPLALAAAVAVLSAGCDRSSSSAYFVLNSAPRKEVDKRIEALREQVQGESDDAKRQELEKEIADTQSGFDARQQMVGNVIAALFGTPDVPVVLPETTLDPARIRLAAGPSTATEAGNTGGLYRRHCVHCHGVTGDGAGPTAEFLDPYPRDFRHGNFKFKKTAIGEKPTHDDLVTIIAHGINGTAMPSFRLLPAAEIDALAEYVKYLSIRGQMETALHAAYDEQGMAELKTKADEGYAKLEALRAALAEKPAEGALADAARKGAIELAQHLSTNEMASEALEGRTDLTPLVDAATEASGDVVEFRAVLIDTVLGETVMMKWNRAEESIVPVVPRPEVAREESIRKGRELFYGRAACVKCHGDSAQGDGQFFIHNDPKYAEQLKPLVNPNLPPQVLRPRNLRYAAIRGGHRDADIYRRLYNGIDNVGMPGLHGTPGITDEEIWHVVDYVQSLPYEGELLTDRPVENTRSN